MEKLCVFERMNKKGVDEDRGDLADLLGAALLTFALGDTQEKYNGKCLSPEKLKDYHSVT